MSRGSDHPNQPSSTSSFPPGGMARIPRRAWWVTISVSGPRESCSHMPPGTLMIVRTLPARVTPRRFAALPLSEAVNQISSPAGDHRIPSTDVQPVESFFSVPSGSITATAPWSSPLGFSWSANATRLPSGEILGWLIQLMLSNSTLPTGYSSRQWLFSGTKRTTAMFSPSAAQSASCTFSSTSRGVPPLRGTRASVPARA